MFAHTASQDAVSVALLQTGTCNLAERIPKPKPPAPQPEKQHTAKK